MMTERDTADKAAMERLQAGDDLALNEIMTRWQRALIHYFYRELGSEAVAIDLAQETFVRLYQGRGGYKPRGLFSSWLFTIATNLLRNRCRWHARHPEVSLDEPVNADRIESRLDRLADNRTDIEEKRTREEEAEAVRHAISQLPEEMRTAIILFEYHELSHEQIGEIQNCSPRAVEGRLYRARHLLKKVLLSLNLKS